MKCFEVQDFSKDFVPYFKITRKVPNYQYSFSKVFLAVDRNDGKVYSCKRIPVRKYREGEWKNPMMINSDRVLNVYGIFKSDYYYYMLADFYDAVDLFENVRSVDLKEDELRYIIKEMALCIKDCHDKNIAHLDIKSENFIMYRKDDSVKTVLIDFEFSNVCDDDMSNNILNRPVGTKLYYAPEIDNLRYCKGSDIWSLACVAYFLSMPGGGVLQHRHKPDWDNFKVNFSDDFKDFIKYLAVLDSSRRPSIDEVLETKWLKDCPDNVELSFV